MKTIGERITKARHAATILRIGLVALGDEDCPVDKDDIRESLGPLADSVATQLLWLSTLPQSVLGAPAPTWDQAISTDVNNPNDASDRIVETALAAALLTKPSPKPPRKRSTK